MNIKYLYFLAAALALAAAAVTLFTAQAGDNVTMRVGFLAVAGVALLYFGSRNRDPRVG